MESLGMKIEFVCCWLREILYPLPYLPWMFKLVLAGGQLKVTLASSVVSTNQWVWLSALHAGSTDLPFLVDITFSFSGGVGLPYMGYLGMSAAQRVWFWAVLVWNSVCFTHCLVIAYIVYEELFFLHQHSVGTLPAMPFGWGEGENHKFWPEIGYRF